MDSWGRRLQHSGGRNTVATSSSGYKKLLRTLQACSGNVNAMTEVARDFLGAGLLAGATVKPAILTTSVEKTMDFFENLENKNPKKEFMTVPRRPRSIKQPATSLGEDQKQQQTGGYDDPFFKFANEMFVAYTNSEPYWSGGMPMSVEGGNAQSYYGRYGVPPSMAMSTEKYNSQPYRGEKGVQPGMADAMFRQPDHGSNGYYVSPEEGWAASMRGSFAGGADARSFSYGGDYHHGLTPYTTPCNNYTANDGPMVCGFCLDSACRCYYTQQHAGDMHFQPSPLLLSKHTVANPKTPSPSTTAITAASPGGLDNRAGNSLALSTTMLSGDEAQSDYGMCYAGSKCVKPSPASECHTGPFTCPGQHGLSSWVILAREYTCHFCGGMIASGVPVLSCSLCQVYGCPSCVWMHPSTSC